MLSLVLAGELSLTQRFQGGLGVTRLNMDLLAAVKGVAQRRASKRLSRTEALRMLVKEGINDPRGELTKEYGGAAMSPSSSE